MGGNSLQVTLDESHSKPATQRPATHATASFGSCCASHLFCRHAMGGQDGTTSPGAIAWHVQQSEMSLQSEAIAHSGCVAPPPPPPLPPAPDEPPFPPVPEPP